MAVAVGGWTPTAEQAEVLIALSGLVAERECTASELAEAAADRLARIFGDTVIVSLLSDDERWLHPLGLADPDTEAVRVLERLAGARLRAARGFSKQVLARRSPLRLAETSPEVLEAGRPELGAYARRFGVESLMVVPMRACGRACGHVAAIRHRPAEPYDEADERFAQLVADWLALAVGQRAQQFREPAADDEAADGLTERERQVLALLALGHTNREIAERLVLSVRTVEWHRARIQWKLRVNGRAALARVARSLGLLET
jgi:DNA-binding CsgD family transcriptional regulator